MLRGWGLSERRSRLPVLSRPHSGSSGSARRLMVLTLQGEGLGTRSSQGRESASGPAELVREPPTPNPPPHPAQSGSRGTVVLVFPQAGGAGRTVQFVSVSRALGCGEYASLLGRCCSGCGNGKPRGGGREGSCMKPTLNRELSLGPRHPELQMQTFWPESI